MKRRKVHCSNQRHSFRLCFRFGRFPVDIVRYRYKFTYCSRLKFYNRQKMADTELLLTLCSLSELHLLRIQ